MNPKRIYIDFNTPIEEWASNNKGMIMDSIYNNVFDFMESDEDDRVVLQVSPKVSDRSKRQNMFKEPPINVDFIISKDDIQTTLEKLLEHMIEVEEYEKCAKIHKLQKESEESKTKPKKVTYW